MIDIDIGAALRREIGLLTEEECAAMRGKDVKTLQRERSSREGPRWVKDGRNVFYFKQDVLEWLKGRTAEPSQQP